MKKLLLCLFVLVVVSNLKGQDDSTPWLTPKAKDYPIIAAEAPDCDGFVPKNWTVISKINGDLNGDKLADCVLVMRGADRKFLFKNESLGTELFDTNPRVLLIAFHKFGGKNFTLVEQNNKFIAPPESPTMTEPFQEAGIKNGVLTFDFEEFYSAGTWSMSQRKYTFRYRGGEFVLIGVDYTSTHRGSGEMEKRSYNLSTGKVLIEKGNISHGKGKVSRRTLRISPKPTLKTIKPMMTWEIEKNVSI